MTAEETYLKAQRSYELFKKTKEAKKGNSYHSQYISSALYIMTYEGFNIYATEGYRQANKMDVYRELIIMMRASGGRFKDIVNGLNHFNQEEDYATKII